MDEGEDSVGEVDHRLAEREKNCKACPVESKRSLTLEPRPTTTREQDECPFTKLSLSPLNRRLVIAGAWRRRNCRLTGSLGGSPCSLLPLLPDVPMSLSLLLLLSLYQSQGSKGRAMHQHEPTHAVTDTHAQRQRERVSLALSLPSC